MKSISPRWKQCVVLVCAQTRPDGAKKPSCGHHGASELRAWLKTRLREEGVWGRVRVVTTSCLDVCPCPIVMMWKSRSGLSQHNACTS